MSLDSVLYIRKNSSNEHVINLVEIYASPLIHNWFVEHIDYDGILSFDKIIKLHKLCEAILSTVNTVVETTPGCDGAHEYPISYEILYPSLSTVSLCEAAFPNKDIPGPKGGYQHQFFCDLKKIKQAFETIFFLANSNNKMEEEYSICYSQF